LIKINGGDRARIYGGFGPVAQGAKGGGELS
jgi:hypothetical protein